MAKFKEGVQVALLGGSFSPPHRGHFEICKYILDSKKADEVWIIPCYVHPFGKTLAPFKDRVAMCHFAVQNFGSKTLVLDIEQRLGGVSHTVRTIEYLKKIYPGPRFSFIMGSDVADEASNWKDYDRIKELIPIIAIPRGPNSIIPNISSSEIRQRVRRGDSIRDMVTTEVAVYIITHGLFLEEETVG